MLELGGRVDDVQRMAIGPGAEFGGRALHLFVDTGGRVRAVGRKPPLVDRLAKVAQHSVLGHGRQLAPLALRGRDQQVIGQLGVVHGLGAHQQHQVVGAGEHLREQVVQRALVPRVDAPDVVQAVENEDKGLAAFLVMGGACFQQRAQPTAQVRHLGVEILDLRLDGLLDDVAMDAVTTALGCGQEVVVADGRDVALCQVLAQCAQVGALATARWALEHKWLARGSDGVLEKFRVERRVRHLVASGDVEVLEQRRRRRRPEDRADGPQRNPTVRGGKISLRRPVQGHVLQNCDALGRAMRAKARVDLVLQPLEALVAVADVEYAEEFVAVLLGAEFGNDPLAPGRGHLGERNHSCFQAALDVGIRPAVCDKGDLADASRIQLLESVEPLAEHRPRSGRLAGLLEKPFPAKPVSVRVRRELYLLEVDGGIASLRDDVIQALGRIGLVVALELDSRVAAWRVEPLAQDEQPLAGLVDVACRRDCGVLDVFGHWFRRRLLVVE